MHSTTGVSNPPGLKSIELRPRDLLTLVVATAVVAITATITASAIVDDGPAIERTSPAAVATTVDLADVSASELAAAYSREPVRNWNGRQYVAEMSHLSEETLAAAFGR